MQTENKERSKTSDEQGLHRLTGKGAGGTGMRRAAAAALPGLLAASLLLAGCRDQSAVVDRIAAEDTFQEETAAADPAADGEEGKTPFDPPDADTFAAPVKEERVSVKADASGSPEKIEVSGTLTGFTAEDGAYITDRPGLSELKNSKGEEEFFETDDGTVYWENLGEDIRYEGVSTEALPVDVRVSYSLDGEELPLQEMKGKSGDVKIRFDYEDHAKETVVTGGEEREMTVPFLAVSLAVLPDDVFSDVEISNGRVITVGGQRAAVGFALPGLSEDLALDTHENMKDLEIPASVEITAQAKEFELEFTGTVLTAGLLEDMDTDMLDDLEEKIADVEELEKASDELQDGADALMNGAVQMQEALLQYANGVNQAAAGASAIRSGIAGYDLTPLSQMGEQLQQIAGLSELGTSLQQAGSLSALGDPLNQLGGLADPLTQLAQLSDLADQLEAAAAAEPDSVSLQSLAAWAGPLRQYAAMSAWSESVQGIAQYGNSVTGLSALSDAGASLTQLSALSDAAASVSQLQGALQQVQTGIVQLDDGMQNFPAAGQGLYDGMTELANGTVEFRNGLQEFREKGIQELTGFFRDDLGDLLQRIRGMQFADLTYEGYTPVQEGQKSSVSFLIETEGT